MPPHHPQAPAGPPSARPPHRLLRLAVGLLAALAPLLVASPAAAVANGTAVPSGGYPFVARLALFGSADERLNSPSSVCSGALIAPEWIITAGHCFRKDGRPFSGRPSGDPTATVGRVDLNGSDGHQVPVVEVRHAPVGDVSLVRLGTPITDIMPLQLNTVPPAEGQVLRISGWGMTGAYPSGLTRQLQTGQVRIARVSGTTIGSVGHAPAAMTCACPSDSGAPYFLEREGAQPVLVGVESDGPTCPHDQEEVATRVDPLVGWITRSLSAGIEPAQPPAQAAGESPLVPDLSDLAGPLYAAICGVVLVAAVGLVLVIRRAPLS